MSRPDFNEANSTGPEFAGIDFAVSKCPSPLILASSSPQRHQLLQKAGLDFKVDPPDPDAEDEMQPSERPAELVARLAYQKAQNVAKRHAEGTVIGCDTVGSVDGQVLGKPVDHADAERMLRLMSGRTHQVLSGLSLIRCSDSFTLTKVSETTLTMDELSDRWIQEYIQSGQWRGKSGGFGLQDGIDWIRILKGSESNVIGLPLELLAEMLGEFAG